jgi:Ca2+-binding EF-hand superfamily protein
MELVDIIKRRKVDAAKLFHSYDKDHSGKIEKPEFIHMVKELLPRMPTEAMDKVWHKFDRDNSKSVDLKEFLYEITNGVIDPKEKIAVTREKTTRCLIALKADVKYYKVSSHEVLRIFDKNKDGKIDFKEFCDLVAAIDKRLPQDEMKLMFDYLDADRNGQITTQ